MMMEHLIALSEISLFMALVRYLRTLNKAEPWLQGAAGLVLRHLVCVARWAPRQQLVAKVSQHSDVSHRDHSGPLCKKMLRTRDSPRAVMWSRLEGPEAPLKGR